VAHGCSSDKRSKIFIYVISFFKVKTEAEKFPGGHKSTTLETWIPENGRGI